MAGRRGEGREGMNASSRSFMVTHGDVEGQVRCHRWLHGGGYLEERRCIARCSREGGDQERGMGVGLQQGARMMTLHSFAHHRSHLYRPSPILAMDLWSTSPLLLPPPSPIAQCASILSTLPDNVRATVHASAAVHIQLPLY